MSRVSIRLASIYAAFVHVIRTRTQFGVASLAGCLRLGDTASVNFLAHLVLAPQTPEGLIGSIAPDMIRGPLPKDLHPVVAAAAKEHQSIDRFTDAHPVFVQTRDRLRSVVDSRLAGIVADVLYDHVLARDWAHYRGDSLHNFIAHAERSLIEASHRVPVRMQMIIRKMIDEAWLASYATSEGIRARLDTMSRRLERRLDRPITLSISASDLAEHSPMITRDFARFWPELVVHVDAYRVEARERLAS
jgi:acyl carrier protein phosphodiesterase